MGIIGTQVNVVRGLEIGCLWRLKLLEKIEALIIKRLKRKLAETLWEVPQVMVIPKSTQWQTILPDKESVLLGQLKIMLLPHAQISTFLTRILKSL